MHARPHMYVQPSKCNQDMQASHWQSGPRQRLACAPCPPSSARSTTAPYLNSARPATVQMMRLAAPTKFSSVRGSLLPLPKMPANTSASSQCATGQVVEGAVAETATHACHWGTTGLQHLHRGQVPMSPYTTPCSTHTMVYRMETVLWKQPDGANTTCGVGMVCLLRRTSV